MRFSRMHGVYPREALDRLVLSLAFVCGAGGSLALKAAGYPLMAAVYAVMVLVIYAVIAWAGGRLGIEAETVGDNCYYLGFLFTLVSLCYTLYEVAGPAGGDRSDSIRNVISGFGIALLSTIVGVFLRVFMMQLRTDFITRDREIRADVNRAFREFRENLSGMLMQSKAFAAESVQMASERDERIHQSTLRFVENQKALIESGAAETASGLTTTFSEAGKRLVSEISEVVRQVGDRQLEQSARAVKELDELRTRLMKEETDAFRDLQERRKRVLADIESAKELLQDQVSAMERFIAVTNRVADAVEGRVLPAFDALEGRFRRLCPQEDAGYHDAVGSREDMDDTMKPTGPRRHHRDGARDGR